MNFFQVYRRLRKASRAVHVQKRGAECEPILAGAQGLFEENVLKTMFFGNLRIMWSKDGKELLKSFLVLGAHQENCQGARLYAQRSSAERQQQYIRLCR